MDLPNIESLSVHEEGEEGFRFDFDEDEEDQMDLRWCLVGRFLCERTIHFNSMKVRMADLWKPVKGVTIKEATDGKFLFHFAHPLDMEAVLKGGPWTFDNNMLILEQVQIGMQIECVPLVHIDMWVQVHDLPMGLMKEVVGVKLANYIGAFVEYDKNNTTSFWRQFMRIRVRIDVRLPLKKATRVMNKQGEWCTVKFKYEKLGMFCFVCGIMGHAENKCPVRFEMEEDNGVREWSADLRADSRKLGGKFTSRWLRDERGSHDGAASSGTAVHSEPPLGNSGRRTTQADVASFAVPIHSNSSNPLHSAIITRQEQLLPINTIPNPTRLQSLTNHKDSDNQFKVHPTFQSLLAQLSTDPPHPIMTADNLNVSAPHKTGPPVTNINSSTSNNHTVTDSHQSLSLPNQTFTFNSQPAINSLSAQLTEPDINSLHKTPGPLTIKYPSKNKTDPKPTRFTQPKKPKNNPPRNNPTRDSPDSEKTQAELEDMELQCDKKRRRDDDNSLIATKNPQPFLTAGPGSQACRDQ
jgi:hypothetical protein